VGFRGYSGGFANNVVNEDSERASTGAVMGEGTGKISRVCVGLIPKQEREERRLLLST